MSLFSIDQIKTVFYCIFIGCLSKQMQESKHEYKYKCIHARACKQENVPLKEKILMQKRVG
jgi:hypothetical protein